MPQDYHIYLHSASDSIDNQTMPFDNRPRPTGGNTDPNSGGPVAPFVMQSINKVDQAISGQDLVGNGFNAGISALAKVSPWIAVAFAIIKVGDKVMSTGFEHMSEYTGRYEYSMRYNNLKTQAGNTINPIKHMFNRIHTEKQWQLHNNQIEQQRTLTGNSIYGDFSTRGV